MTALLDEELYLTPDEYLALNEASDVRLEYVNGYVYAMAGGSLEHAYIGVNIASELHQQLRGKRCAAFGSDKRLAITAPRKTFYYYPDVTVDCSEKKGHDTIAPTALFEVISSSTRRGDEGDKLVNYLNLPSLRVYVLAEQRKAHLTVHRRSDHGLWVTEVVTGLAETLMLPEIECVLPLRIIYDRVDFGAIG